MIGRTLGHYEITAKLGVGGMGEVYLAKDTTLQRDVALKLLPQDLAGNAERLARFRREATVLAALNHPNIAQIHGLEESDGHLFLVMERALGEDLQARLRKGAVGVPESVAIAQQIAAGLEEAHEKGVVHRDLKPANVMVSEDGRVKILDFGLARAYAGEQTAEEEISLSPTITAAMTQAGTILGTAAYMSPEQARGKPVDRRADIWSFGIILFEMLTGRALFHGETISDTLAAILKTDPDLESLPEDTPVALRWLIERCLRKQPTERLRDIGEARVLLESDLDQHLSSSLIGVPAVAFKPSRRPVLAAVLLTAVLALAGGWFFRQMLTPAAPEPAVLHASLLPPPDQAFYPRNGAHFALSPDGSSMAFVATDSESMRNLWVRELSRPAAYMLTGTQRASYPFWSPDGTEIGFFADGKMKRISRSGGVATIVCDARRGRGGSWGTDDRILFAPSSSSEIHVVSATGGAARAVTELDVTADSHRWPLWLPDGEHFLYTSQDPPMLRWGSLSGDAGGIVREAALQAYLSQGELIFGRDGALWAQPFDVDTRETLADERLVSDAIFTSPDFGSGAYSASADGRLVYVTGQVESANRLMFYDLEGNPGELLTFSAARVEDPIFSPDGRQLAVTLYNIDSAEERDIWIRDIARGTDSPVTTNEGSADPVWAPTQDRIAYSRGADIVVRSLRGSREVLLEATGFGRDVTPHQWTKDGRRILYQVSEGDSITIGWFDVENPSEREELVADGPWSFHPSLSPDEKWLVYGSNKSGTPQVYLRDVEGRSEVFLVTRGRSTAGQWSPDGREIYFHDLSTGTTGAVSVEWTPDGPVLGDPRTLLTTRLRGGMDSRHKFRVTPEGDRLLLSLESDTQVTSVQIVSDWKRALETR